MRFSGLPHRPNPVDRIDAPLWMRETASSALETSLFMGPTWQVEGFPSIVLLQDEKLGMADGCVIMAFFGVNMEMPELKTAGDRQTAGEESDGVGAGGGAGGAGGPDPAVAAAEAAAATEAARVAAGGLKPRLAPGTAPEAEVFKEWNGTDDLDEHMAALTQQVKSMPHSPELLKQLADLKGRMLEKGYSDGLSSWGSLSAWKNWSSGGRVGKGTIERAWVKLDRDMEELGNAHRRVMDLLGLKELPPAWGNRIDLISRVPGAWEGFQDWLFREVPEKVSGLNERSTADERKEAMTALTRSYGEKVAEPLMRSGSSDFVDALGPHMPLFGQYIIESSTFFVNTQHVDDGWLGGAGRFGDRDAVRPDGTPHSQPVAAKLKEMGDGAGLTEEVGGFLAEVSAENAGLGFYNRPPELGCVAQGSWEKGGSGPTAEGGAAPLHLKRVVAFGAPGRAVAQAIIDVDFSDLLEVNMEQAKWLMETSKAFVGKETLEDPNEFNEGANSLLEKALKEGCPFAEDKKDKIRACMLAIRESYDKAMVSQHNAVFGHAG